MNWMRLVSRKMKAQKTVSYLLEKNAKKAEKGLA